MSSKSKTETLDENSNSLICDDGLCEPRKRNGYRGEDQVEAAAPQIQEIKQAFKRKSKSSKRKKEKRHDKNGYQANPTLSHSSEIVPADPKIPKLSSNDETTKAKLTFRKVFQLLFKRNDKKEI